MPALSAVESLGLTLCRLPVTLSLVTGAPDWCCVSDAARLLSISPRVIRKWIGQGLVSWDHRPLGSRSVLFVSFPDVSAVACGRGLAPRSALSLSPLLASVELERLEVSSARPKRDAALSERDDALSERDAALSERDAALSKRDDALSERDDALSERDAALSERDAALSERDDVLSERDAALSKRDAALSKRDAALSERDAALSERDALRVERDALRASLSASELVERSTGARCDRLERDRLSLARELGRVEGRLVLIESAPRRGWLARLLSLRS